LADDVYGIWNRNRHGTVVNRAYIAEINLLYNYILSLDE